MVPGDLQGFFVHQPRLIAHGVTSDRTLRAFCAAGQRRSCRGPLLWCLAGTARTIQQTLRRAASGGRRARSDQPRENDSLSWTRRGALKWPHAATLGEHEPESAPSGASDNPSY